MWNILSDDFRWSVLVLLSAVDISRSLSTNNSYDGGGGSKFSAYKDYIQSSELSEREVTSAIQKGHQSMMAALTTRGRNMEIIHKLWQNKDAKAGEWMRGWMEEENCNPI